MKHFRLSFFLTILLSMMARHVSASWYNAEVDGVYYFIRGDEAIVTPPDYYNSYRGDMVIPSTITYLGETYDVTQISDYAFSDCRSLTSITIHVGVTSIGDYAFSRCSNLTFVSIPESVTSIGSYAFWYCSSLTSVTINCPTVGSWFRELTSIQDITLGDDVASIGYLAFYGCSGLTSLTIPKGVTSIDEHAFSGCRGLTSIIVDPNNPKYDSRDNCNAIIETETNTLVQGCNGTTIPESVTSIGDDAFSRCNGLTTITIPGGVTSIGDGAFAYCI